MIRRLAVLALLVLAGPALAAIEALSPAEAGRRLASGGWLMMMRHAATEAGVGDPPNFRIGDCGTQRKLSDAGRAQARRAGAALRALGVRVDEVLSSQWCRCRETAELAFGAYENWPALNSFFGDPADEPARTAQVIEYARRLRAPRNAMLVTHQVNIRAAMGTSTAPGEVVAGRWQDGRLVPAFRFRPDQTEQAAETAGTAPGWPARPDKERG